MPKFMKMLNNISRSQSIYRNNKVNAADLHPSQYAFILSVCREEGRSQEEIARDLCLNKSTAARNLNALEENGYVTRASIPNDKRQFSVYPTKKALAILPEIKKATLDWMNLLSEGISEEELEIFNSVLMKMQDKAREIIDIQEGNK